MTSEQPMTRWGALTGHGSGETYQARFDALASSGADPHGEAHFVASWVDAPARVLDAGCGTGRVATRLAELGYDVVGVDADPSMLGVARSRAPSLPWVLADLSNLDLAVHLPAPARPPSARDIGGPLDVVVLAGNVVPLLSPGTLEATMAALARHLAPGSHVIAGFGLDAAHLPGRCPVTPLADYDEACRRTGLHLVERFGTWDRHPVTNGYAVSIHQLTP